MKPPQAPLEKADDLVDLLAQVPFLSELTREHIEKLIPHLRLVHFVSGEVVFPEGEVGDTMYVIRTGRVRIYKSTNYAEKRTLAERGPGEYFGEMALIDDLPRSAGIEALEPTELIEISKGSFRHLIEEYPGVGYAMLQALSRQLREADVFFIRDLQTQHEQLKRAYEELKEAQHQLKEKARMEQELRIAHDIQMSLLPRDDPTPPGFDIRGISRPAHHVGGDFYSYTSFSDGALEIIVGDVSGKSLPGAIFMAVASAVISSESVNKRRPSSVLEASHSQLVGKMSEHRMFVATTLGLLDPPTGKVTLANAGQIQPIYCSADGSVCDFIDVCGFPLGMIDYSQFAAAGYRELEVQMQPDDLIVFTSDGISEAMNHDRQIYGLDRLCDVVASNRQRSSAGLIEAILGDVDRYSAGAPQGDDITIVVMKAYRRS